MKRHTWKKRNPRGATVVETALVLPLLLILTFGGIKYGWLFFRWHQVTNITRHAARVAARPGDRSGEVAVLIAERMEASGIAGYSYTISNPTPGTGESLVLEISVPGGEVDILNIPLLPRPTTLSASMALSKEGP